MRGNMGVGRKMKYCCLLEAIWPLTECTKWHISVGINVQNVTTDAGATLYEARPNLGNAVINETCA